MKFPGRAGDCVGKKTGDEGVGSDLAYPKPDDPVLLAMYEELVEGLPLALYRADIGTAGRRRFASHQIEEIVGLPADRWTTNPAMWFDRVHPDDRNRVIEDEERAARLGELFVSDYRIRHADGHWVWVRDRARLSGAGILQGAIVDISDEKEREESFRILFANNPLPMWVYDRDDLRFLAVNGAAIEHYGYSEKEFLAMKITDIRAPDDVPMLMTNLRQPRVTIESTGPWHHVTKTGEERQVEIRSHTMEFGGFPAALVVVEDITERLDNERERAALEAHLRQAQKMHSLGKLAGGIAHDFNNILGVIRGYGEFLEGHLAEDAALEDLKEILKAADRGVSLVRQLLLFSRKEVARPESLDINEVIRDTLRLLRRSIGEDIEININLADDLPPIRVDRSQLDQVIINLAVNARDAMPQGGKLFVESSEATFEDESVEGHPEMNPGGYVCLSLTDTGSGMPADIQEKIFDPFFTTKERGQGTGLGLATVYGVVQQAAGFIYVYSEPDQGTTFRIYLPACTGEMSSRRVESPAKGRPTGHESIILVEDDDAVRELAFRILTQAGFKVSVHSSPGEAMAALEDAGSPDLLLTDVVMPGMSGRTLADQVQAKFGPLPVVFMSGYSEDLLDKKGHLDQDVLLLQKPFSARDLLGMIRSILDAS